jgi:hypothetical protein
VLLLVHNLPPDYRLFERALEILEHALGPIQAHVFTVFSSRW